MGCILRLPGVSHAITLNGLRQDHRRLPGMFRGCMIGRINFVRIVAATVKPINVIVAEVLDHLQQLRIFGEKIIPYVLATLCFEVLIFAVHCGIHSTLHQALTVFREQRIPMPPPHHFDDIPTSTPEVPF